MQIDNTPNIIVNCHKNRSAEDHSGTGRSMRLLAVSLLGTTVFALGGCATMGPRMYGPRPQPVRVASIVQWSHADVPPATIIRRIRRSGTVYHVNAGQIIHLHQQGVANTVLDYMQATEIAAIARNRARMDIHQWHRYNDGYYYGGIGYGWEPPEFNFGDFDEDEGGGEGQ